jgi:hypothetical protein
MYSDVGNCGKKEMLDNRCVIEGHIIILLIFHTVFILLTYSIPYILDFHYSSISSDISFSSSASQETSSGPRSVSGMSRSKIVQPLGGCSRCISVRSCLFIHTSLTPGANGLLPWTIGGARLLLWIEFARKHRMVTLPLLLQPRSWFLDRVASRRAWSPTLWRRAYMRLSYR